MSRILWIAAPMALAALALAGLPAPFAWIGATLAACAFRAARSARARPVKRLWILVGSTALPLALAEALLPGKPEPPPACDHASLSTEYQVFDDVLGFAPRSARVVPAAEMRGNIGFDGVYTIDEHGLRKRFPSDAQAAVLLFGCSYMFGLNVADEETLAYLAGRALADDYVCYNFGYIGYGPHEMLAALQSGRVDEIVEETPKHVFFQLINSHVRRVVGNGWYLHAPRYVVDDDGKAVRAGRLCDPQPEPGLWTRLLEKSALYRKATAHTLPADVDTLVAVLTTARDEFERRYPGCSFHVLVWDKRSWKTRHILRGLKKAQISIHRLGDILPGFAADPDSYYLPADHHPNQEAHARLAQYVAATVRGRSGAGATQD